MPILFTENLKGKNFSALKKIKPVLLIQNLGVPISPARRKCALLPYDALKKILHGTE